MRIVYMGTPEFAATALRALASSPYGQDIVGVITQEDKPKNRGHILTPTPVKAVALELGIPVYQPINLKPENFAELYASLAPDLVIVAAYGKILPPYVLEAPQFGCINIHGSLLPAYRGAAPIQRAIMAGESTIGITIMYMEAGLDTGDMLAKDAFALNGNESYGEIHDRLADLGANLLLRTLPSILDGTVRPEKQDDSLSNYAAKIDKQDQKADFNQPAITLHNRVRALSPAPCVMAMLNGSPVKIVRTQMTDLPATGTPGETTSLNAKGSGGIYVNCLDKQLLILQIIPEGKKEMSAGDFIRGRKVEIGQIWS